MKKCTLLFLALALLFPACTPTKKDADVTPVAQTAAAAAEAKAKPDSPVLPTDPAVIRKTLPNGLTYYIRNNGKPENRLELRLAVNTGSVLEDDDQQGLAHFVEHMAFNGTKNFQKQELVDYIQAIGMRFGADLNAFTSFDETVYMLQVPTDDDEILEKAFLIMEDWAHNVSFDAEEIEKERGVVVEEWRRGRGGNARIQDKQYPLLFHGSKYAERLPIGKPNIIETASRDTIVRFYKDWYRPDLMALVAVGDVDPEKVEALILEHFSDIPAAKNPRERPDVQIPDHKETLFSINTDPEVRNSVVQIAYKHPSTENGTEAEYRDRILAALAQGMLSSRLSERIREANPPYVFGFSAMSGLTRNKNMFVQAAMVKENGFEEGMTALMEEAVRVDRHGFTATELERQKQESLRTMEQGFAERDKTDSRSFARELRSNFLTNEPYPGIAYELELYRKYLPTIDLAEVNGLMKRWITKENRVIMVSGPEKDGVTLPTQDELLAIIDKVEARDIKPYQDETMDAPLVANPPAGGKIIDDKFDEALGIHSMRLSNGVKIIVKPTDFKNDQVLFTADSPGGHSLVSDAYYVPATTAVDLIDQSGLGSFNATALEKKLAGKVVSVGASIGELTEGFSGSASPQDLETALQLVYLYFTAPRMDDAAFEGTRTRYRAFVENRTSSPEAVFGDQIREALYNNHPRRQPFTTDTIDAMNKDQSLAVFKERFADASDFTFVFVGNVDLDSFKPLAAKWLGGLPSLGREESFEDVGVKTAEGRQEIIVNKGLEPKSAVRIIFTKDVPWSMEENYAMRSAVDVLRIRLREVLREDMSGVYGVSVQGALSRRPRETFSGTVSFNCNPENVEALTNGVMEVIKDIQENGVESHYIDKVKETQLRTYEVSTKRNNFWLANLAWYNSNDIDPHQILEYPKKVETLTPAMVQDAVVKYFSGENLLIAKLFPQEGGETEADHGHDHGHGHGHKH